MKRSRACDDLVALAEQAQASSCALDGRTDVWRRVKRSRASHSNYRAYSHGNNDSDYSSGSGSGDEMDVESDADSERHSLQFSLELSDLECRHASDVPLSSSAPARCTLFDYEDDSLPLRRNSREQMLRRKQQHKEQRRLAGLSKRSSTREAEAEVANPALSSKFTFPTSVTTQRVLSFLEAPETPETRVLRSCVFPRESRCIDPLDKRQAQPFDMSAFIMLSISPKP